MTHPRFQIHKTYFVQQGNSATFRTGGGDYVVVEETWEGAKLLDTVPIRRFPLTPEGKQQAEALVKELQQNV